MSDNTNFYETAATAMKLGGGIFGLVDLFSIAATGTALGGIHTGLALGADAAMFVGGSMMEKKAQKTKEHEGHVLA